MKTNLEQLVDSYENFNGLLNLKLPTKVAYWVNRIYNKVTPIVDDFKEQQNKLIIKYGEMKINPQAGRNTYEVKEGEQKEKYLAAVKELVKKEIELPFDTIKLEALNGMQIEPKFLIEYIFVE